MTTIHSPKLPKLSLLACLISALTISGCGSDNDSENLAKAVALEAQKAEGTIIESIIINGTQTRIKQGETHQLTATGIDSNGDTRDITSELTWSSADETIATISTSGLVTGVANTTDNQGIVKITGTTINDVTGEGEISISDVAITGLSLKQVTPETGNISTCIDAQISADITYEDDYKSLNVTKNINWSVDSTTTASISKLGYLYTSHQDKENTTVTGTINNISDDLIVTADPANLNVIDILLSEEITTITSLNVGERIELQSQASLISDDTIKYDIDNSINWEIKNFSLAGISNTGDNKGSLLALKPGTTQVIASCGGVTRSATIEVKGEADLASLTLNENVDSISIGTNETLALTLTANYEKTTAPINVSEFATWDLNGSELVTSQLKSLGTDDASLEITSSATKGELILSVSYDDKTRSVKIIID